MTMLLFSRFIGNRLCRISVNKRRASSSFASFYYKDLVIERTDELLTKPDFKQLPFGRYFSDHMFTCTWSSEKGWDRPYIKKFANISLHPACKVFHYAQEVFDGMKAYGWPNGDIRLFRPKLNLQRMIDGAGYCALPSFDIDEMLLCMKSLIALDRDWVPRERGTSLYIRPTIIGIEPTLGVAASRKVLLFIIIGPVGSYVANNPLTISLYVSTDRVRAFHGGVGHVKMGSNYAPTLKVTSEAEKYDCQQVLWLTPPHKHISEVGAMNIFVHWTNERGEEELFTPALDGTILPGIVRQSILELARKSNVIKCTEGHMTIEELMKAVDQRRVHSIFGSGTASVMLPVHRLVCDGRDVHIPVPNEQSFVLGLMKELMDIHHGDKGVHPWMVEAVS